MIASTCKGNYHIMIISTDYGQFVYYYKRNSATLATGNKIKHIFKKIEKNTVSHKQK